MKISRPISTLFALALGITAATAATGPVVTVDLAGTQFGNGVDVHVTSGTQFLLPATSYQYRIEGSVSATGLLGNVINGMNLADLINDIEAGGSDFLDGTQSNPAGTLPFTVINKSYNGTIAIPVPVIGTVNATASVTIKGKIATSGQVRFDVTNVSLVVPGFTITDKIEFDPGSKLVVTVSPVIQFKTITQSVAEDAGTLNVKVKRTKNLLGAVSVTFAALNGTADGTDFTTAGGIVNFADGEATKLISIPIIDNGDNDGNRAFKLRLSLPTGGAILGLNKKTNITITDDE